MQSLGIYHKLGSHWAGNPNIQKLSLILDRRDEDDSPFSFVTLLSLSQIGDPPASFGSVGQLAARRLATGHRCHESPSRVLFWRVGIKKVPVEMVSGEAWWMDAYFVRKDGWSATSQGITGGPDSYVPCD